MKGFEVFKTDSCLLMEMILQFFKIICIFFIAPLNQGAMRSKREILKYHFIRHFRKFAICVCMYVNIYI